MSEPNNLCCPVCGRSLGIPPHVPGNKWTARELWWAKLMAKCMPLKSVASFFGVKIAAMSEALGRRKPRPNNRRRVNLSVPSYAVMVHLVEPLSRTTEDGEKP